MARVGRAFADLAAAGRPDVWTLVRDRADVEAEARAVETAVDKVLSAGLRTGDIASRNADATSPETIVGTIEMGKAVIGEILAAD